MSLPTQQKAWIVNNPPAGAFEADTFKLVTRPLPELKDGEVLVQLTYLSNDPAQRGWIQKGVDPKRLYVPPVYQGDVMRCGAVGLVLASKSAKYAVGDRVAGSSFGWYDYGVVHESQIMGKAV
jgi:NADPH-dependent curcumin reductase CurA